MKNQVSNLGFENRVLTPSLFASNFNTMKERVKIHFTIKYRYTSLGNRTTGNSVEDYLQLGLEKLVKYNGFNFETCKDFNNEDITILGFQKLWFYASQQSLFADNVKSSTTKNGKKTKIVVGNIVANMDGKDIVSDKIENKLIELDSNNTKTKMRMNVRSLIRKAIEKSESNSDKKFYERVLAHLVIQSAIRKADNVSKAISLKEIIDCFDNHFQNVSAYSMFRKRMETDVRLKRLKMVA